MTVWAFFTTSPDGVAVEEEEEEREEEEREEAC